MSEHARASSPRTVGVEEELLLVDPESAAPVPASEAVLAAVRGVRPPAEPVQSAPTGLHLEREVKQEQIEIVSAPQSTLDGLERELRAGRRLADQAASAAGATAVALATSVLPSASHLAPNPRYEAMRGQFGLTMTEQLTCGMHVHVEVRDETEGVAVLDRIRPWLPVLHALSTNSPFWDGVETGFSSFRYQAWSRWPSAGPYDVFGSPEAYRGLIRSLLRSGVLLDTGMVYFDARLSDHHPTVEVRVADVCLDVAHAVAIAALVRALVETAAREWAAGVPPHAIPSPLLRMAMWSASRYGVRESLVDPHSGSPCPAREAVDALLAHVAPVLEETGDLERAVRVIDEIFAEGTGADRQLRAFRELGDLPAVVAHAARRTHEHGGST